MKWIKFSTDALDGLSLKTLKAKFAADYYRDTSIMLQLLTLVGKADSAGELRQGDGAPMATLQIAILLGLPVTDIDSAIDHLSAYGVEIMGITDDGAYKFCAWDRYQDSNRAEYQRQRRATKKATATAAAEIDQLFDQFWAIYPRHVGKQDAYKAFNRLAKAGINLDAVVAATCDLANDPEYKPFRPSDPVYIPYPATWLNGHRYEEAQND